MTWGAGRWRADEWPDAHVLPASINRFRDISPTPVGKTMATPSASRDTVDLILQRAWAVDKMVVA
jgi:hypothetical protein